MMGAADEGETVRLNRAAQRAYCKEQTGPSIEKWFYGDESLEDRRRRFKAYQYNYEQS